MHDDAFLFTTQLLDYYNDTGYVSSAGFVTDFWCDNVLRSKLIVLYLTATQCLMPPFCGRYGAAFDVGSFFASI